MTQFIQKLGYLDEIMDDRTNVVGEIYIIINLINIKLYVGQVVSHHKNHNKYRPYGYKNRFKGHIGEALYQNKKNQSVYLNNSIRKYGADNFTIELICRCELDELDKYEQYYIDYYQTLYPSGYNLTIGGKGQFYVAKIIKNDIITEKVPYSHGEETKKKISLGLKKIKNTPIERMKSMKRAQDQHDKNRLRKFANCVIDQDNLDQYIHPVVSMKTGEVYYYKVFINGIRTDFKGKEQNRIDSKERAINFLKQLPSNSAQ